MAEQQTDFLTKQEFFGVYQKIQTELTELWLELGALEGTLQEKGMAARENIDQRKAPLRQTAEEAAAASLDEWRRELIRRLLRAFEGPKQ